MKVSHSGSTRHACPTLVIWLCRYAGIIDLTRKLNAKYRHPRQTQEATKTILRSLFPSWLPRAFKVGWRCMYSRLECLRPPTVYANTRHAPTHILGIRSVPCSTGVCEMLHGQSAFNATLQHCVRKAWICSGDMQLLIIWFVHIPESMGCCCRWCFRNQYPTCQIVWMPGSLPWLVSGLWDLPQWMMLSYLTARYCHIRVCLLKGATKRGILTSCCA